MSTLIFRVRCALVLPIVSIATFAAKYVAAETPPPPPQRLQTAIGPDGILEFSGGPKYCSRIPDIKGLGELVRYEVKQDSNADGRPFVGTLSFSQDLPLFGPGRAETPSGWGFSYNLQEGDVVPMLGHTEVVTELTLKLKRVSDPELLKVVAVAEDSIVIPVGGGAGMYYFDARFVSGDANDFYVKSVAIGGDKEKTAEAKVQLSSFYEFKSRRQDEKEKTINVVAGEQLPLNKRYNLTVKRVVPTDKKRRIVGWVELSPNLVPSEAKRREDRANGTESSDAARP